MSLGHPRSVRLSSRATVLIAVGWLAACSSTPSTPNAPASPTPSATVAPAPSTAPPTPPAPVTSESCRYGSGSLEATCGRRSAQLEPDVNAAIDRLAAHHPEYFDTSVNEATGEWRVLREHEYLAGVVDELRAWRFCAETDQSAVVSVKNSNEFSEDYNVLLATGHVRRGGRVYEQTCTPAAFPVAASDAIAYVRVHFYGLDCEAGIETPRNGADELPIGCRGFVTATPKLRNNEDVPRYIVGSDVSWRLEAGSGVVAVHDYPDGNAFNKIVVPLGVGHYTLCATSHGVVGCQDADVRPDPRR
jgi:hypothetical protein